MAADGLGVTQGFHDKKTDFAKPLQLGESDF